MFISEKKLLRVLVYFCVYLGVMFCSFIIFLLSYLANPSSMQGGSVYLSVLLLVLFFIVGCTNFIFLYTQAFQSHIATPINRYIEIVTRLGIGDAVVISPRDYPTEYSDEFQALNLLQDRMIRNTDDLKILNSYISHEMKNSISVLSAMVQLHSDQEQILQYIGHMNESVENILALSQVKTTEESQTTDLSMVCAMAVNDYRKKYKNILLTMPDDGISEVPGRENLFYRAISNLLDNAIKYGNGTAITVDISEKKGSVVVCVHNYGKPINNAYLENIFETNYRIKTLKRDSYGIGLSLVKNVMEVCHGAIWVESNLVDGTSFYLVCPSEKLFGGDIPCNI
ncbi:MAG: HAMP domain-containing sensor histidine kinase [Oscillospiraceae bacterium]